jgi:hypothetical protein
LNAELLAALNTQERERLWTLLLKALASGTAG